MGTVKILVADDNHQIRELVAEVLRNASYDVITAVDGDDAVEKIYKENPSLCILDYEMPGKTGFEVVREVRSRAAYVNMPIMIFTAVQDKSTRMEGLGLDIDDYLNKPADEDEIIMRVKLLLRRSQQKLSSNPLTGLPGTPSLQANIEARILNNKTFAVLYCDLNNFKSYNDQYGFEQGDKVLKFTAETLVNASKLDNESFVGHIGGDDFILISSYEHAEDVAKQIVSTFDSVSPTFYNETDRKQGFMRSHDRQGAEKDFPFLSIGIGIVHNKLRPLTSFAHVSSIAAELKAFVKQKDGSVYAFDRRDR